MASKPKPGATTNSGIKKLSTGESVIPSSTRADGTVRKEIRVKPGYRPPEDVEVYKNRTAEAWKNRGKGGVPGAQGVEEVGAGEALGAGAATNKNAKRREARRRAAEATVNEKGGTDGAEAGSLKKEESGDTKEDAGVGETVKAEAVEIDPEVEKAKEARKLAKKLRQARELKEKKENGDSLLPEQFAKVIKINELIRQLDNLGFDAEGERKDGVTSSKPAITG